MPKWAIISIYAVTTALCSSIATLLLLKASQNYHWEIGTSALAIALGNLCVVAISLSVLASVFRFRDRRER